MTKKIVTDDGEIIDAPEASSYSGPIFFKTPFNHDTDEAARETALTCKDPSRTKQSFARDADINVILAKFMANPDPLMLQVRTPQYMNVDEEFDLQNKMVTAYEVQEAWDALPIAVRNMLRDPKTFADYVEHCMTTGDLEPLRELGLAQPREEPLSKPTEESAATTSPPTGTPAAGEKKAP